MPRGRGRGQRRGRGGGHRVNHRSPSPPSIHGSVHEERLSPQHNVSGGGQNQGQPGLDGQL